MNKAAPTVPWCRCHFFNTPGITNRLAAFNWPISQLTHSGWKDNIKIDPMEVACKELIWNELSQDEIHMARFCGDNDVWTLIIKGIL
jgi:hypothetical protein